MFHAHQILSHAKYRRALHTGLAVAASAVTLAMAGTPPASARTHHSNRSHVAARSYRSYSQQFAPARTHLTD